VADQLFDAGDSRVPCAGPRHSVSVVAAVIDDDGRFLAIRRADTGAWEPPGGVLELDESIEAGLVREVEEETGVRVQPVALTGIYKNMQRAVIALVFRCRPINGAPGATEEAVEVAWLSPDQVNTRMTEAHSVRLTDAVDRAHVRVRAHHGVRVLAEPQPAP
jgi:8-oxo-dGTP diphosphatase